VFGSVFFTWIAQWRGCEIWKTDGTTSGTVMVRDIRPGPGGSYPKNLTNLNGSLIFIANDGTNAGTNGYELWKSDGTESGTVKFTGVRVKGHSSTTRPFVELDGELYFSANDGVHGYELWKTDGTTSGTVMVSDVQPGKDGSHPWYLTNVNGSLFFAVQYNQAGWGLWKSDGTGAGTVPVSRATPDSLHHAGPSTADVNGVFFFRSSDEEHGVELWRSDGTEAGTVLVKDIWPGPDGSRLEKFHSVNGVLLFLANDGRNGVELWKSDGTESGTMMVSPSADWNFDVFPTGPLRAAHGRLYLAANDGANGIELWQADGTAGGTHRINIRPGPISSRPNTVFAWNGNVVVVASDGVYGHEMRTLIDVNGAPSGTDGAVTTQLDAAYTLAAADFGFSDPTDTPVNSLAAVKIASLPPVAAGTLILNSSPVSAGQFIPATAIAAGQLQFVPEANARGSASFGFQVQDDGGTANGGVDLDPTPNKFTINVSAHPWHNAVNRYDVNNDSAIAPDDVLAVINYINAWGSGPITPANSDGNFYDVDADDFISPRDALFIINQLNASPTPAAPEGESSRLTAPATDSIFRQLGDQAANAHSAALSDLLATSLDAVAGHGRRRSRSL
jgi:ELWxxDGT repeat protein